MRFAIGDDLDVRVNDADGFPASVAVENPILEHSSPPFWNESVVGIEIESVDFFCDPFCGKVREQQVPGGVLLRRDAREVSRFRSAAKRTRFAVVPGKRFSHAAS